MKNLNLLLAAAGLASLPLAADARIDSWITQHSGRYARIYLNDAALQSGTSVTTWNNGAQTQAQPAYAGVQELASDSDWVYVRTTGLALHPMGPWQNGTFPNLPTNRKTLYRIPRNPTVPTTQTLTGLGVIGCFVDGVAMFDSRDGFVWTGAAEAGMGNGYWNREAYVNEGATFDPGYAHQENSGTHHYHANPVALRYLLGDHVDFDETTRKYRESTAPVTRHSPILGWVRDGFPVYGPYAFSEATNATSALRRMTSGFQLRNGQRGTDNLSTGGRSTISAWAQRAYGVGANQSGPAVSTQYPLGRYMEDNAFLGDLTHPTTGQKFVMGVDYDLDENNGRWCVTPEFPAGTYAYFVAMADDGTPVYPYNIGRSYHGNPTGSVVTEITAGATTHFVGGTNAAVVVQPSVEAAGEVTLVWNALEGGTYSVERSTDLKAWTNAQTNIAAVKDQGTLRTATPGDTGFFRVRNTALAAFDPATGTATGGGGGGGGGGGMPPGGPALTSVSPNTGARGTTVSLTMILGGVAPPATLAPTSALLGTIAATQLQRNGSTVTARFAIPANAPSGPQTVSVTFPGPPGQGAVTFSLANAVTIP
jgi:hypothetical protein